MAVLGHLSGRFGRSRGWRRRITALVLLAIVLLVGLYLYVANPQRLSRLAADLLAEATGAEVHITSASLGLDGTIDLQGVSLRVPDQPGAAGRLFDAEQITVRHRLASLLRGRFQATSLLVFSPSLYLTEDTGSGQYNYQALRAQRKDQPGPARTTLPEIFIRQGRIHFGETDNGRFHPTGTVRVDGKLTEHPQEPGAYFFALRQDMPGHPSSMLNGQFHPHDLTVTAELEHFAFDTPYGLLLPRKFRRWWEQLDPAGSLPTFRVAYDPDPTKGLHATIELKDVELSLPYAEWIERIDDGFAPLPSTDASAADPAATGASAEASADTSAPMPRMTHVSGRFTVANDTVQVEGLRGQIEGIAYQIDGQVFGLGPDAPFRFEVRTDPFAVPADPPYLYALPRRVQRQFNRVLPSGQFQATVTIERRRSGERLAFDGVLELLDAKGTFWRFPYPLHNIRGQVRFTDQAVQLVEIRGVGPTGAQVQIDGTIAPPGPRPAVQVVVQGRDIPIDEHLVNALEPRQQQLFNRFFDQTALDQLIDQGLLAPAGDTGAAEASDADAPSGPARPAFALGGTANAIVQVQRELDPAKPYAVTIQIDPTGVAGLLDRWPYPLRITGGSVLIRPDGVSVNDVTLQCLTGGRGTVRGSLERVVIDPEGRIDPHTGRSRPLTRYVPQLEIADAALPIDDLLLASLPPTQAHWVRQLNAQGRIGVTGQILGADFDGDGDRDDVDFRIRVSMDDGRIDPFGGGFALEQVQAQAVIQRHGITIESFLGRRNEAVLQLSGEADWSGPTARHELHITGTGLPMDRSVLGLLPPEHDSRRQLTELMTDYRLAGLFDVGILLRGESEDRHVTDTAYHLTLAPRKMAFDLRGQRIALRDMTGDLLVNRRTIELRNLAAHFGQGQSQGQAVASGLISLGDQPGAALRFEAQADRIDEVTRALMPQVALRVTEGLELDGPYRLRDGRLLWRRNDTGQSHIEFEGVIGLDRATATVGVPLTEISGDLYMLVATHSDAPWPRVDLRFDGRQLRAAGRLIQPLSLHVSNDHDNADILHIQRLRAACYGGALVGQGHIELARHGHFQLAMALQDAALEPVISPEKHEATFHQRLARAATDHASDAEQSNPSADPNSSQDDGQPLRVPLDPEADRTRGLISAQVNITATPGQPDTRRGRGAIDIRNASMYELPLAITILQIANLSLPTSNAFDRAAARFLLDGDLIRFDLLRFEAPSVEIAGTGTMRYDNQRLDLELYSRNPNALQLGAISDLFNVFKDEILRIRIRGTLDNPQPQISSFSGITRTVARILGDKGETLSTRPTTPLAPVE